MDMVSETSLNKMGINVTLPYAVLQDNERCAPLAALPAFDYATKRKPLLAWPGTN